MLKLLGRMNLESSLRAFLLASIQDNNGATLNSSELIFSRQFVLKEEESRPNWKTGERFESHLDVHLRGVLCFNTDVENWPILAEINSSLTSEQFCARFYSTHCPLTNSYCFWVTGPLLDRGKFST